MNKIIIAISLALLFAATASATQPTLLSVHGTVKTYPAGGNANGDLNVEIWDDPNSTNPTNRIYSNIFAGGISNGKFDVMIGATGPALNLDYGKTYYLILSIGSVSLFNTALPRTKKFVGGQGQITSSSSALTLLDILNKGANAYDFTGTTSIGGPVILYNGLSVGIINNYEEQGYHVYDPVVGTLYSHTDLKILFGKVTITAGATSQPVYFGSNIFVNGPFSVIATPRSNPGTYYWVTSTSGNGFNINQLVAAASNIRYDYIVIGYYVGGG